MMAGGRELMFPVLGVIRKVDKHGNVEDYHETAKPHSGKVAYLGVHWANLIFVCLRTGLFIRDRGKARNNGI